MTFDAILALYANGATPIQDSNGWIVACPLCAGALRLKKAKTVGLLCEGKQCPTIDILKVHDLTIGDLSNGSSRRSKKAPQAAAQTPPMQPPTQPQTAPASFKTYNTTDMGNAERFVDRFKDVIRYCSKLGKDGAWLIWDNCRWQVDEMLKIHKMAKEIVPQIYDEVYQASTKADKKRLFKWAVATEALSTRGNMIRDSRPMVAIAASDLDTHPWLLNVKNGTLDLQVGVLSPHVQTHYLTKMLQIHYDPKAPCDHWMQFIERCQKQNPAMIEYLQKAIGYSLTGIVSEKAMFILQGPKDTGKSTFVETMQMLFGEYGMKIQTQSLMWKRERQQSNDIAMLKGARFVHASEAEERERLAESQIKEMTGGDTLSARFLHAEFFQFQPEFKLWLSTNQKPKVSNDDAVWGRLKIIRFAVQIPEDQQDKSLKRKLQQELPGILRWAVEGCHKWQRDGLGTPPEIVGATSDYRKEQDVLGHFIDDQLEFVDSHSLLSRVLYEAYKSWCTDNGEKIESQRALGLKLSERGLCNDRTTGGKTRWLGVRLRA
jgi:putative DNA primase/helicase